MYLKLLCKYNFFFSHRYNPDNRNTEVKLNLFWTFRFCYILSCSNINALYLKKRAKFYKTISRFIVRDILRLSLGLAYSNYKRLSIPFRNTLLSVKI